MSVRNAALGVRHANRGSALATLSYMCVALAGCSGSGTAIKVTGAWAPATPPGVTVGVAYMQIEAREADTLVGFSSPAANAVELHRTSFEEGVARMRKVDSVVVSPNTPLVLAPSGMHLMLHELAAPLEAGERFSVTLRFQRAGEVSTQIEVLAATNHPGQH